VKRVLALILSVAVLSAAMTGAAAVPSEDSGMNSRSSQATAVISAPISQVEENNSTVQHEDPDEVDQPGNTGQLRAHLSQQLARRLAESSANISEGEYEAANESLGPEYRELLSKYVQVSGGDDGTDSTGFQSAADSQRKYAQTLREYQRTRSAYEEAVNEGNETRARELARQLRELSETLDRRGNNVTSSYQGIENQTNADLSSESTQIRTTTQNATNTTNDIVSREFQQTNLTVTRIPASSTTSVTTPLTIRGQLVQTNGSAVANESIIVVVGSREYTTTTNATGAFSLAYRPTLLQADATEVAVQFRPKKNSVLLGANSTLPIQIQQQTATLSVSGPESIAYGDQIAVTGTLSVNETPVPNAPVTLTIGDVVLATTRTNDTGQYSYSGTIPSSIGTGNSTLEASLAVSDRAVVGSDARQPISVRATETHLSVTIEQTGQSTLLVKGALQTANNEPLAEQPIEITGTGGLDRVLETNETGAFEAQINTGDIGSQPINVTAVFSGMNSNLESARAHGELSQSGSTGSEFPLPGEPLAWGGLGGAVLMFVGMAFALHRNNRETGTTDSAVPVSAEPTDAPATSSDHAREIIDSASERYSAGDTAGAVELAFTGVRRALTGKYNVASSMTHREFVSQCQEVQAVESDELETLSRLYEYATFGQRSISGRDAEQALEIAETLVNE